jgi:hypothetical protein
MNASTMTIEVLRNAGWHEKRKINIESIVRLLESRGFEVYPAVRDFLEEFGMLEINLNRAYLTDQREH